MKPSILLICLLVLPVLCFSQKDPIKFGKISLDELEMKAYEPDTSASAVVLCDYGYFQAIDLKFTRVIRVKILKKEGYNWANWVFPSLVKGYLTCNGRLF
jgi:hypothetical protein